MRSVLCYFAVLLLIVTFSSCHPGSLRDNSGKNSNENRSLGSNEDGNNGNRGNRHRTANQGSSESNESQNNQDQNQRNIKKKMGYNSEEQQNNKGGLQPNTKQRDSRNGNDQSNERQNKERRSQQVGGRNLNKKGKTYMGLEGVQIQKSQLSSSEEQSTNGGNQWKNANQQMGHNTWQSNMDKGMGNMDSSEEQSNKGGRYGQSTVMQNSQGGWDQWQRQMNKMGSGQNNQGNAYGGNLGQRGQDSFNNANEQSRGNQNNSEEQRSMMKRPTYGISQTQNTQLDGNNSFEIRQANSKKIQHNSRETSGRFVQNTQRLRTGRNGSVNSESIEQNFAANTIGRSS